MGIICLVIYFCKDGELVIKYSVFYQVKLRVTWNVPIIGCLSIVKSKIVSNCRKVCGPFDRTFKLWSTGI